MGELIVEGKELSKEIYEDATHRYKRPRLMTRRKKNTQAADKF